MKSAAKALQQSVGRSICAAYTRPLASIEDARVTTINMRKRKHDGTLTVGFIGVGKMGRGMAANLMSANHPVRVIAHKNRAPVDGLVRLGATETASLRALVADCAVIFLCVPDSDVVEKGMLAPVAKQRC